MNRITSVLLSLLLLPLCLQAQATRRISAQPSVDTYRQVGEVRIWTWTWQAKDMGRLISTIEQPSEVSGQPAVVFNEKLNIDYKLTGVEQVVEIEGKHYAGLRGQYLGDDLEIKINDQSESLHLRLDEQDGPLDKVEGYFTRGGNKVEREGEIADGRLSWDVYLVDHLEIWLAMQDLGVGDTLSDSLFVPQEMRAVGITAVVDSLIYMQLYKGRFDSVFVVSMIEPYPYQMYFTPDQRLVRVDLLPSRVRVYQDYVGTPISANQQKAQTQSLSFGAFLSLLPRYAVYAVIGVLCLLLFAFRGFKWPTAYIGLAVGFVLYLAVAYGVMPLQAYLLEHTRQATQDSPGLVYLWWVLPSAVFGISQELLKAMGLLLVLHWRGPRKSRYVWLGAFLGVGFALMEACFQSRGMVDHAVFEWPLFDRTFTILFHATAGALFGWALSLNWNRASRMLVALIGVNTLLRYLPVFALQGTLDVPIVYMANALISVGVLLFAFIVFKRKEQPEDR